MFRKEFAEVIGQTGMVPLKDLRPLLEDKDPNVITEFRLLELPFFDDVRFGQMMAQKFKLPFVDLTKAVIPENIIRLLKKSNIMKYRALPVQRKGGVVTLVIYDPSITNLAGDLRTIFQLPVDMVLTSISAWEKHFNSIPDSVEDIIRNMHEITTTDDKAAESAVKEEDIGDDVIRYCNRVLAEAYVKKASDIHFEPYEKDFRIRIRIDGSLVEIEKPPHNYTMPLLSRVKILAGMDISERRKPQDGRIKMQMGARAIDYRVSSLPTLFGEKIVLRLLDSSNLQLDMTKLGFEKKQLATFKDNIHQPYGMCLVTGPTGSGKTTTLYSALSELNQPDVNISTAEDPVEFNLRGINQVNVRKEIDLTFASALKAFLRQDPDIIMVGEIRDFEVGEIAVEAALTGHLVLSTLHTNDAPSTVTRLLNMGIEPFLVVASLNVVVAQRLCRKICPNCKIEDTTITPQSLTACGVAPGSAEKIKVFKGKGCKICNNTGYKGRVAIYEVMAITPAIKEIILRGGSSDDINRVAIQEGMKTLRMSALTKVAQGLTTLDEAVTNSAADKM